MAHELGHREGRRTLLDLVTGGKYKTSKDIPKLIEGPRMTNEEMSSLLTSMDELLNPPTPENVIAPDLGLLEWVGNPMGKIKHLRNIAKIRTVLKNFAKKFKPKTQPMADIPPTGTSTDELMQMMDDFLQQSQQNIEDIIPPNVSGVPSIGVVTPTPIPPSAIGVAKSIPVKGGGVVKVKGIVVKAETRVANMSYEQFDLKSSGLVGSGYNLEKGYMSDPIVRVLTRPSRVLEGGKVRKGEEVTFSFWNREPGRRRVKIEEVSQVPGDNTRAHMQYDLYDHGGKTYVQGFHFYGYGWGAHEQKAKIMAGRLFQDFMKQVPEGAIFDSGSLTLDSLEFVLKQLVKMNKKGVKIMKHPTFPHMTKSGASRLGITSEIASGKDRYINTLTGRKMNGKKFDLWRRKKTDEVSELRRRARPGGDITEKESDALVNLIKSDLRNWEKQLFSKKDRIEELQKIFNDMQKQLLKQGKMSADDIIDFKVISDPSNVRKLKVEWPAFEIRDFKSFIPLALGYPSWKVMERELYGEKIKGSSS